MTWKAIQDLVPVCLISISPTSSSVCCLCSITLSNVQLLKCPFWFILHYKPCPLLKKFVPPTLLVARVLCTAYDKHSLLHVPYSDFFPTTLPPPYASSYPHPLSNYESQRCPSSVLPFTFAYLYYNNCHNNNLLQVSVCMPGIPGNSKPSEEGIQCPLQIIAYDNMLSHMFYMKGKKCNTSKCR